MKELNIMLACAAGMSTSLLVTKMQQAAEQKGIEAKIYAVPVSEAANLLSDEVDCVLLGPQVKYLKADFEKKVAGTKIKLDVINMVDYGMMNGEKVLATALAMIGE